MRRLAIPGILLGALLLAPSAVLAVPIAISGSNGENNLGSFTGSFDYIPVNATSGSVIVTLDNTSPLSNGGFITAFAFNVPGTADVTSATLASTLGSFATLLGGPPPPADSFDNDVNGAPFGQFDIGAGVGGNWEGGGTPSDGISVALPVVTFTFNLTGTGLGTLTPQDFLSTLSVGPGIGGGPEEFVVRFRGFEDGGSDKVPVDTLGEPIPEPGTMVLLSLGLATLSARRLHSRKP